MRDLYGTKETNSISDWLPAGTDLSEYLKKVEETVEWTDNRLARITRLRLLSDPGFPVWDVSYCWGELKDGTPVYVDLPFSQLSKGRINAEIIAHARRDRVFAKGLDIFNSISTLI